MKPSTYRSIILGIFLLLSGAAAWAQSPPAYEPPPGWQAKQRGDETVMIPEDLAAGELYQFIIKPPKPADNQLPKVWFQQQMQDEAKRTRNITDEGRIQSFLGVQGLTRRLRDSTGQERTYEYLGFRRNDGQMQVALAVYADKNVGKRYNPIALRYVSRTLIPATGTAATPATAATTPSENEPPAPATTAKKPSEPTASTRKKKAEIPTTAPGKGVQLSQIDGMYLHQSHGTGYGGMIIITFDPHLLLKDGSIYKNVKVAPADLDVARSKQEEPNQWGTWKRTGNAFTIQWNDGDTDTWDEDDWFLTLPATEGEKLNGEYSSIGGGGNTALGGDFAVAVVNDIVFTPDGKFSQEKTVGGGNSGVYAYSNKATSGTYALDGYTIELRYGDGRVTRQAFYYYPAKRAEKPVKNTGAIGIGSSHFLTED